MEGCAQTASYNSLLRRKNFARTEQLLNIALHDDKLRILITLALPEYSTVASMVCQFHRCQVFRAPITRMSVATLDIPGLWSRGHAVTRLRSARELPLRPTITNQHRSLRNKFSHSCPRFCNYVPFLPHRRLDIQFPTNLQQCPEGLRSTHKEGSTCPSTRRPAPGLQLSRRHSFHPSAAGSESRSVTN